MYSPIEATLICYSTEQNENGYDEIKIQKQTEIYTTLKSVSYNEFYKAYEVGIKPRLIAVMYAVEYEEAFYNGKPPSHIVIENIPYIIVREYQNDIDHIELTLEMDNRNEVSLND